MIPNYPEPQTWKVILHECDVMGSTYSERVSPMKFRIFAKNNTLGLTRNICQKLEDYILEIQIYVTYIIFRLYKSIKTGRVEQKG